MEVIGRVGVAASGALLVVAGMALVAVGERVLAALWQWYKFSGYGGGGAISLSRSTAVASLMLVVTLMAGALWLRRHSFLAGATLTHRLSTAALVGFCAAVVLYTVVALSPLNVWRV